MYYYDELYGFVSKLVKSNDPKTKEGRKAIAFALKERKLMDRYYTDDDVFDILRGKGVSPSSVRDEIRLEETKKDFLAKFGDVAMEFINTLDKCFGILDEYTMVDSHWNQWHNDYAKNVCPQYKTLNEVIIRRDTYNLTLELKNYNGYNEKFVRLLDVADAQFLALITRILNEKYDKEMEYRKEKAWKGEINLESLAEQLQPLFPNIKISVRIGKRQNDGDCKPYKAIVVGEGIDQLGTITLGIDNRGIGILTKRVPLCGESSCEVTNDNVLSSLKGAVEFMLN